MKLNIKISAAALLLTAGGMLAVGMAPAVLAHGGATGIVKERMDAMGAMGKAVKSINGMLSGKQSYDAQKIRSAAEIIEMHAGKALLAGFPEGSTQMPSEAKPDIWQDWAGFTKLANQLEIAAQGLSLAAANKPQAEAEKTSSMSMMMGAGKQEAERDLSGLSASSLGALPADAVFKHMLQICSACHTAYRIEKP